MCSVVLILKIAVRYCHCLIVLHTVIVFSSVVNISDDE